MPPPPHIASFPDKTCAWLHNIIKSTSPIEFVFKFNFNKYVYVLYSDTNPFLFNGGDSYTFV